MDAICSTAFPRAFDAADFLVVDEIVPMEVYSDDFIHQVRHALDTDHPLIAAIHYRSTDGFIGEVKDRTDTTTFEVTETNRDKLPATIAERLRRLLGT